MRIRELRRRGLIIYRSVDIGDICMQANLCDYPPAMFDLIVSSPMTDVFLAKTYCAL